MLSKGLDGLQWNLCEKLKTAAAYGPVLRKFQSAIILQFLADRQKSDNLYDYDTLYKVWMNQMKIGRSTVLKNCKIGNFSKGTEWPQTKFKESGIKSTLPMCTVVHWVPHFRPFRSTISRFRDI